MIDRAHSSPHYGGQIGFVALLSMLCVTGCVTLADQSGTIGFLPGWAKTSAAPLPVQVVEAKLINAPAATFIVRFNNVPQLDPVYRNFRRDEAATRAAYSAWASDFPQLEGLLLVRASYSGELILGLSADDPAGRSALDVLAALETMDILAYAEIDSMASTSERS